MGNHTNRGQIHNDLNQLLEDAEYTYTYTENGHLWKKVSKLTGERTEYEWSIEGKMTKSQVLRPDGSIKSLVIHKYDALERRISKETNGVLTRYAYDNEDIIVEFGFNETIKAVYLHGPGIDEPIAMARDVNEDGRFDKKEVFFYSKDHLNSIHDLTDFEGKPVQRYNYSAYGKTKIEKTNPDLNAKLVKSPYGYTSREWDQETGDYYYRARFYDPRVGRFLSEDPIGLQSGDNNSYRYALNNPVLLDDPDGKNASAVIGAIGIGVIVGIIDPLGCSKPQEPTNPREQEIQQCEADKARILEECSRGVHTTLICNAQSVKVCR